MMKSSLIFFAVIFNFSIEQSFCTRPKCAPSVTTFSGSAVEKKKICKGDLIFEDNFDFLDFKKWEHENTLTGGGNNEFQWYNNNRTNSFVKNGKLYIRPSLLADQFDEDFLTSGTLDVTGGAPADQCTNPLNGGCMKTGTPDKILNPLKSARLRTVNTFRFKYGRIEISARMPVGDWLWPALWMMPAENVYGSWPSSGEIDIAEMRGNRNLMEGDNHIGNKLVTTSLHFGPYWARDAWAKATRGKSYPPGYDTVYKTYALDWTPDKMTFSIDGEAINVVEPSESMAALVDLENVENPYRFGTKMAPFDQEFYIIFNLAIGGTSYFPDSATGSDPKPWKNNSPTAMKDFYSQRSKWLKTWNMDKDDGESASLKVDYVRVYAN